MQFYRANRAYCKKPAIGTAFHQNKPFIRHKTYSYDSIVFLFPPVMNYRLFALLLLLAGTGVGFVRNTRPALPAESVATFVPATAIRHMDFLASDRLMGRNTPSPGLDTAAEYIARQFRSYGLEPVNGTYFHEYTLQRAHLGDSNVVALTIGGVRTELAIRNDYIPFGRSGSGTLRNAEIVFAGYGITAPEFGYDDYAGVDVRGRIVVALKGEPQTSDSTVFNGPGLSRYAQMEPKLRTAEEHGAAALILISNPLRSRRLRPVGFAWPSLYPQIPASALPLVLPRENEVSIPAIDGGERLATLLFGGVDQLKQIQKEIESSLKPRSFALDATGDIRIGITMENYTVRNVMAVLRGSEKPDEYVVAGAHYDHVGYFIPGPAGAELNETENGLLAPLDSIYNGADDNASGTTGLLLMAEALARAPERPHRSILFVAFSAEEKGLLGSKAFVRTSPVPTTSMVAMLNMDMIGRNTMDSLSIGGNTRSPELAAWNEEANRRLPQPFTLVYNIENYFFRSDQASFAMRKIPVLFYHSGEHEDYHKVGDEMQKINFTKLVQAARLCADVTWQAAETPQRPSYVPMPGDRYETE